MGKIPKNKSAGGLQAESLKITMLQTTPGNRKQAAETAGGVSYSISALRCLSTLHSHSAPLWH